MNIRMKAYGILKFTKPFPSCQQPLGNIVTSVSEFHPCHLLAEGLLSPSKPAPSPQSEAQTALWPQALDKRGSEAPASRGASVSGIELGSADMCYVLLFFVPLTSFVRKAGKAVSSGLKAHQR